MRFNVSKNIYIGASITDTYNDSKSIRRRIMITKAAVKTEVTTYIVWKDRTIDIIKNKEKAIQSLVFSIAMYESECYIYSEEWR